LYEYEDEYIVVRGMGAVTSHECRDDEQATAAQRS
jgi:hypothetical protein